MNKPTTCCRKSTASKLQSVWPAAGGVKPLKFKPLLILRTEGDNNYKAYILEINSTTVAHGRTFFNS